MPALVLGFIFSDNIDAMLESPTTVAVTMLVGGIILLFIDKLFNKPVVHTDEQDQLSQGLYNRLLANHCHDPGGEPQRCFYHRRYATKIYPQPCC